VEPGCALAVLSGGGNQAAQKIRKLFEGDDMATERPTNTGDIPTEVIDTDLLIIGGGNAGCFAAIEAKKLDPNLRVTIMEKAHISRSGATAAGMDAINTYIPKGKTPEDLVRWSRSQVGGGPIRNCAERMPRTPHEAVGDLERWGLPLPGRGAARNTGGRWERIRFTESSLSP